MKSDLVLLGVVGCAMIASGCESLGTAAQSKTVQGAALGSALGGGLVGHAMEENSQKAQQQTTPLATTRTKFCPVGGELYGEDMQYCPNHGVELRYKQ